jgi:hypothetical protein
MVAVAFRPAKLPRRKSARRDGEVACARDLKIFVWLRPRFSCNVPCAHYVVVWSAASRMDRRDTGATAKASQPRTGVALCVVARHVRPSQAHVSAPDTAA